MSLLLLAGTATAHRYRRRQSLLSRALSVSERRRSADLAERQRAVDAQVRLAAIIEAATDFVGICDPSGRLIYVNHVGLELLAVPPGTDLSTLSIADVLPCADHAVLTEGFPTAIREGIWNGETELRAFDGRRISVSQTILAHKAADGTVSFVSMIAHDMSERNAREAALRESIDRFNLAARATFNVIWDYDLVRDTVWRNDNYQSVFGYPVDSRHGLDQWASRLHPDDRERVRGGLDAALQSGATDWFDAFRYRRADGTFAFIEDRCQILRDDAGRPVRMVGAMRDVTDTRDTEQLLRLQGAALDAAANGIVITDRDGTILWTNPGFTAITGYPAADALGRNPRDLLRSGVHEPAFYRQMWDTITRGEVWRGEMTNRRKDGTMYRERQTISPLRTPSGSISHFIGIKEDLTVEERLEQQFRQSQKMEVVGHLAGGIAHDFNNLLTVINMSAELLLEEIADDVPLHEDARQILEAGRRAASLTQQLLAFSRKQVLKPGPVQLGALVSTMQQMLQRLIGSEIVLGVSAPADLGVVRADAGQIEQVIMNLVVNARDAMPEGGWLSIAAREAEIAPADATADLTVGRHVVLSVTDTGSGMDAETRSHLFEPFFSTKGPGLGTGLGLATVYGIVKQSGGAITVDSAPGRGTTFRVFLPRVDDDAALVRAAY